MAKWSLNPKKVWEQLKAGWKPYLTGEKKFKDEVTKKYIEGVKPIPEELRKYQKYWESREFNDNVNRTLATLAKYISPALVAAILKKVKELTVVEAPDVNETVEKVLKTVKNIIDMNEEK